MFISSINIRNYRLFPTRGFSVDDINVPDGENEGSGVTVFVGENGCGKTSLLEALSLPLLSYKADGFTIDDLNDPKERTEIEITANSEFRVNRVVPRSTFRAKGFSFEGGIRSGSNRLYLSSVTVGDLKYVPANTESIEENSPDLRVSVSNPWSGPRFKENDILYLDKNRTFQIQSGKNNQTRFDRLMEDFDFQYLKNSEGEVEDINVDLGKKVKTVIQNEFLEKAMNKFKEISDIDINLEFISNHRPFLNAFFGEKRANNLQIEISRLGSGYEMIFALLCSFYLSEQSERQLIMIIDEPELHLHPSLLGTLVDILLDISKTSQVILSSQSPLFVKQLFLNKLVKFFVLKKSKLEVELMTPDQTVLPSLSANEINYVAFNLPTHEYHNELYGYLHELFKNKDGYRKKTGNREAIENFDSYLAGFGSKTSIWKRADADGSIIEEKLTIHTCIRHKRHHPDNTLNDGNINFDRELNNSILFLREKIAELRLG